MTPVKRGQRAAWFIFAAAVIGQIVTLYFVRQDNTGYGAVLWLPVDFITAVGGLVVATIVHFLLPKESRKPFWATGAICMGLSAALFGVTCGLSFA